MIRAEDPVLPALTTLFENELNCGMLGGQLYVDALKAQLCIHMCANTPVFRIRLYGSAVSGPVSAGGAVHRRTP